MATILGFQEETIRRLCKTQDTRNDYNTPITNEDFLDSCIRGAEKLKNDNAAKAQFRRVVGDGSGI